MHNEAAKKLTRRDCDAFAVLSAESDRLMRYGHNAAIANSDPMSITPEVAQYVHRVGEGLFDIDQPVDFSQFLHQPIKRLRVGKIVASGDEISGRVSRYEVRR